MSAPLLQAEYHAQDVAAKRSAWRALRRGFAQKCPACGEGRLFGRYLKVNPACPDCGEELHHHRADDAPPYATIFVVGHIVGALMLLAEELSPDAPLWLHALIWPTLTVALSLALLPRLKGALIAYQWALRMHGFETASPPARAKASSPLAHGA